MRFRHRAQPGQLPEINLTPMLNVMMGILAFFVMITMMLTEQQGVNVQLPSGGEAPLQAEEPLPMVVQLTADGQLLFDDQPLTQAELEPVMRGYLEANPTGFVVLQATGPVPYEQVVQTLAEMKTTGGDRVSLAID